MEPQTLDSPRDLSQAESSTLSRIENRPLTKPSEPHRFADLGQAIAAMALLIIPAFLYASERANLHDANKHISALEARLLRLRDARELLLVERATELDPRRLRDKARTLAGLVDPERGQMTYLPRPAALPVSPAFVADATDGRDGHP